MSFEQNANSVRYTVPAEHRSYKPPPPPPEAFAPPRVSASAIKATDSTVLEQAYTAMVHARNEFQKHIDETNEQRHHYTDEGYRGQIARFRDTDAAKAVDAAAEAVQARRDQAQARLNKVRRDLSPAGDTAKELRATRFWNRTKAVLDGAKEPGSTARELIANGSREELGVLLEELPAYFTAKGQSTDWIDASLNQAVPEFAAARAELRKADVAVAITRQNADVLRRGFDAGRAPRVMADPFSDRLGDRGKYDPDAA